MLLSAAIWKAARLPATLMQRKPTYFVIAVALLTVTSVGCAVLFHRHQSAECKQRGAAYRAKREKLERDAVETLRIGTPKNVVTRFFQDNGIPVTFVGDEATGTIYLKGCAPNGCGSDDALLGLRVKVDKAGTVISEPSVGAIYTNCL